MDKPKLTSPEKAMQIVERFEAQGPEFETMKSRWQEIADYIQPRANITSQTSPPDFENSARLFSTTAIRAKDTLTRGMVSMMTPAQSPWFAFDAPPALRGNEEAKAWFAAATEIIRQELGSSNFYTEVHEWFDTWAGFGPASMHVEEGKRSLFNFTNLDIGTFAFCENDEGYVDTIWICKPYTIRQLVQKFGIENVSEKSREAYNADGGKRRGEKVDVIHEIRPREDGEYKAGDLGGQNKPIASCYVERAEKHLLRESGYDEMPSLVGRFYKSTESVYGASPSWFVLPDARQLNFLEKMLDVIAEKSANPPMKASASMEGVTTIDLTAGGVTYGENDELAVLAPILPSGTYRYDIGAARVEVKEAAIREGFFVDVFRMFSDLDKTVTAYEASQLASEKIYQFSSAVTRLTMEFFNPLLQRVWAIAVRSGKLPQPPDSVFEQGADGESYLPEPEVTYKSRIALAVKQIENLGFMQTIETISPILTIAAQVAPEVVLPVLDRIDFDAALPDIARNNNMPERWIRSEDAMVAIRNARAQAQQAAAQQQALATGTEAVKNLSAATKELPAAA